MNNTTTMFLVRLSHVWDVDVMVITAALGVATAAAVRFRNYYRFNLNPRLGVAITVTRIFGSLTAVSSFFLLLSMMHLGCAELVGQEHSCESNIKQLSQGVLMYCQDYDEHLPRAADWDQLIEPALKQATASSGDAADKRDLFVCPSVDSGPSYAMNGKASGVKLEDVMAPAMLVLVFDAESKGAASLTLHTLEGGPELMATQRHVEPNVGFLDGHVKMANTYVQNQLVWDPKERGAKP